MAELDNQALRHLQDGCLEALDLIRDEIHHLFQTFCPEPNQVDQTLRNLFAFQFSRSQAVSFLISWGYSWDAEIVLRTFYEASAKLLFITLAEQSDKQRFVNEFWEDLGSVFDRKTAQRALHAEGLFEAGSVSAAIFGVLQDDSIFDLAPQTTRTERKDAQKRWSFTEIVESLQGRHLDGKPLTGIKSLLHIYGMASHLAHADKNALELMADRAMRETAELRILEAGHISRMMTDQVSMTWFCAVALKHHLTGEFNNPQKMIEAFEIAHKLSEPIQKAFEDSQKAFYAKWAATPKTEKST